MWMDIDNVILYSMGELFLQYWPLVYDSFLKKEFIDLLRDVRTQSAVVYWLQELEAPL